MIELRGSFRRLRSNHPDVQICRRPCRMVTGTSSRPLEEWSYGRSFRPPFEETFRFL